MDLGGSVALVGVLLGGWATGRIKRDLEGVAWGERAATITAWMAAGCLTASWGLEAGKTAGLWAEDWIGGLQTGLVMASAGATAWFACRLWVWPSVLAHK